MRKTSIDLEIPIKSQQLGYLFCLSDLGDDIVFFYQIIKYYLFIYWLTYLIVLLETEPKAPAC